MRVLPATVFVIGLAWWAPRPAEAQLVDFATCAPDLVACDANTTNCCYRDFAQVGGHRAIVIPMDRCHQRMASGGTESPPGAGSPAWCVDPSPSADDGIFQAYGLVYRLMQQGIPVYWIINPTKDPPALNSSQNANSQTYIASDIDMWVLGPSASAPPAVGDSLTTCNQGTCTQPVRRLRTSDLAPLNDTYRRGEFPVRGSAFLIAPEDRARFNNFWMSRIAPATGNNNIWNFHSVDMYEVTAGSQIVYQDFRGAGPSYPVFNGGSSTPVAVRIDYDPPRLARLGAANVSGVWLSKANLFEAANGPQCLTGAFTPSTAVFCNITIADIAAGYLVDGQFDWAWIDNWGDNNPCSTPAKVAQVAKVAEFMTAVPGVRPGGHVMFMEAVIDVVENCPGFEFAGTPTTGLATRNQTPTNPLIIRYPSNLFLQWGDIPTEFASGSIGKWQYFGNGATGYLPSRVDPATGTLVRLVTEDRAAPGNELCVGHKSTPACDVFGNHANADYVDVGLYWRHEDDPRNGIGFYMGGNNVNGVPSQLRMILNALIAVPAATVGIVSEDPIEVSRNAPIVATVDGVQAQYQGTYEYYDPAPQVTTYNGAASDSTFEFPYTLGHMRAIDTADLSETATEFTELPTPIFDAADGIPDVNLTGCAVPFTSSCRTVFTSVERGALPAPIFFNTGRLEALKPHIAPNMTDDEAEVLISRVLAGRKDGSDWVPKLGGVDRSTVAVIEFSPLVGGDRPTMAYFGALDGMLHAVCAEEGGACQFKGQELWAYIPRNQLPNLRHNTQRIDGSPKVADVFGDFNGDGNRAWRTVLTFQTGSGRFDVAGAEPSVLAIDITVPHEPQILWDYSAVFNDRGDHELGVGVGLALGPVRTGGNLRNLTFAQTNNGGLGGPGFVLTAIDTITGEVVWTFERTYPEPRDPDNAPVPATGIPGGVAAIDIFGNGSLTHVVAADLYGELWLIDAATGLNVHGDRPLFRFDSDYHPIGAPPTIYMDRGSGKLHALIVSGGYADPVGTSWAPDDVHQYAVSIALDAATGVTPIADVGPDGDGARAFVIDLGAGNRASAQAIVAGNELFITTDDSDVNAAPYGVAGDSGMLRRFSLDGGGQIGTASSIAGGASSVGVRAGVVFVGSGRAAQKHDVSATFDADGQSVELTAYGTHGRMLWLRRR